MHTTCTWKPTRESPDPSFPVRDTESNLRWGWFALVVCISPQYKNMVAITCELLTCQWLHQADHQADHLSPWASLRQKNFHLLAPEKGKEEEERNTSRSECNNVGMVLTSMGGREEGMMECDGAKSVSSTPSTSSSESPRSMKLFCVSSRRCK